MRAHCPAPPSPFPQPLSVYLSYERFKSTHTGTKVDIDEITIYCDNTPNRRLTPRRILYLQLTSSQPFVDSKEDQNTIGKCPVSPSAIQAAKSRVEAWQAPGQPGHALISSSPKKLCILDGFLLYGPDPPLRRLTDELLDVKFLLTVSRAKATARREARDGYVTLEGFWADPPGYVEKIVWPNYAASHAWLFEGGDVEKRLRGDVLRQRDILALPQVVGGEKGGDGGDGDGEGLDVDMRVMFEWAVDTLMRKLEEVVGKR